MINAVMKTQNDYILGNKKYWDEVTPLHEKSAFYDVESFKKGKLTILPLEIEEICFDKKLRIYFKPLGVGGDFDYTEIKHIGILEKDCFDVDEGKLSLTIKKDFNEVLVRVE